MRTDPRGVAGVDPPEHRGQRRRGSGRRGSSSLDAGAVLFFQLVNARHERASTVLPSNKGFEEWGDVLSDEVMGAARACILYG